MSQPLVVAIDGPAGAGKSTISRKVAARLGSVYIDTGAMYRAVALSALRNDTPLDDAAALESLATSVRIAFGGADSRTVLLNGEDVTEDIRTPQASEAASKVSSVPGVRRAMVLEQRRIAASSPVVMEGRDIGTVVFPDAQVKVYLDADPRVRAVRRAAELEAKGQPADVDEIAKAIAERDHRDATREDSPMKPATDAVRLDTSGLNIDQVEQAILDIVAARTRKESLS